MSEEDAAAAVAAGTMVADETQGYGYSESTGNWYYSNYPNYKDFNADGKLKVAFIAGVVVACPYVFWQIWSFVKPALYEHEKRAFRLTFAATVFLFLLGVAFCYAAVYFLAVDFFLVAGENLATPMLAIDKYVSFLFGFVLPFGLAFELPVALYITTRMGLTNYQMLASKRKFVILAVVVVAAFLTPPDVVSQIMLSIPILILFEVSLLICKVVKPKAEQQEEA